MLEQSGQEEQFLRVTCIPNGQHLSRLRMDEIPCSEPMPFALIQYLGFSTNDEEKLFGRSVPFRSPTAAGRKAVQSHRFQLRFPLSPGEESGKCLPVPSPYALCDSFRLLCRSYHHALVYADPSLVEKRLAALPR